MFIRVAIVVTATIFIAFGIACKSDIEGVERQHASKQQDDDLIGHMRSDRQRVTFVCRWLM